MTPKPHQREVIESWDRGDVCVVAGPGSGKTFARVERFRWLVQAEGVPVRRVSGHYLHRKSRRQRLWLIPAGMRPAGRSGGCGPSPADGAGA